MPLDLAKRKQQRKKVEIDCGDGESFFVFLKPRAYSWDQQLEWQQKLGNLEGTPTPEQGQVLIEWASGILDGFEGLLNGGVEVTMQDVKLGEFDVELLGFIFNAVTDSLSGKAKANS